MVAIVWRIWNATKLNLHLALDRLETVGSHATNLAKIGLAFGCPINAANQSIRSDSIFDVRV